MNYTKKLYDNCVIYGINGELLGHCNFDKFNWYIKRGLADQIDEKVIKLKFIPKEWNYYEPNLIKKENYCVNCGTKEELTRHHVIPKIYIKYFPIELKSSNSHDVILMCIDCHSEYELEATKLKKKLAIKYDAPINSRKEHVRLHKAYSCLSKLLNMQHGNEWKMNSMICNMMYTVETYMPNVTYTDSDLKILRNEMAKSQHVCHGKKVMEQIKDYQKFAELWREHFIEIMNPTFMPDGWNIKTKLNRCKQI